MSDGWARKLTISSISPIWLQDQACLTRLCWNGNCDVRIQPPNYYSHGHERFAFVPAHRYVLSSINLTCNSIWHDANNMKDSIVADFAAHCHSLGLCVLYIMSATVVVVVYYTVNKDVEKRMQQFCKVHMNGGIYSLDDNSHRPRKGSSKSLIWEIFHTCSTSSPLSKSSRES